MLISSAFGNNLFVLNRSQRYLQKSSVLECFRREEVMAFGANETRASSRLIGARQWINAHALKTYSSPAGFNNVYHWQ